MSQQQHMRQTGVFLTRIPLRVPDPRAKNEFSTTIPLVEFIPFTQIAWAMPYTDGKTVGTLILLNTLEFRGYVQSVEFIKTKVCEFVGRNARAGVSSPSFPWVMAP